MHPTKKGTSAKKWIHSFCSTGMAAETKNSQNSNRLRCYNRDQPTSINTTVDADIHIRTDIIAGYPYPAYHQTNY